MCHFKSLSMKKLIVFTLLIFITNIVFCQALYIFGGDDYDVFLGCINCSRYDSNSIWNSYGNYGSKYSSTSIWNKYSNYGGRYSNYSPFNRYASKPPVIVDANGNFYGYLTINKYFSNRSTSDLTDIIVEYWEKISEDVSWWYDHLFK